MEEENKNNNEEKKLTYDELKAEFGELHLQYQKLVGEYQKAMSALHDREFDYMSFFLQMLFKVIEYKQAYKPEFGKWAADNIMHIMTSFAQNLQAPQGQPQSDNNENGKKDEA